MLVIQDAASGECLDDHHAVTIGVFDGVHRGHRYVLEQTRRLADHDGARLAVVTFDPHPARVIRPDSAPKILTGIEHRLELLKEFGVETTVVIHFDEHQAQERARAFVDRVIVDCLKATSVAVGNDFHFGYRREGTTELLGEIGAERGFDVQPLDQVLQPGQGSDPVSSTAIRRAIASGDVEVAAAMLGRLHQVRGEVRAGDQRGRVIGFPTANIDVPPERAIPADGVYAAWYVFADRSRHPAAVNVGKRPTFYEDADRSLVEAHLIDFDGDLYGTQGKVEFVKMLRTEQRFDGIEALKAQLETDVNEAATLLRG
ncbi:MAG: bifunctional riboflavin kinase/FAD synthetase [Acidimicrobiales bacterium]|nr:bifunctional riboflavin kinase/FAD synthetase [Acidimicrobiales bacterium]